MKHRPAVFALVPVLVALVGLAVQPASSLAAKPAKKSKATVFEACRHGCHYRTIQKAVEAAGSYAFNHKQAKVTVVRGPLRRTIRSDSCH